MTNDEAKIWLYDMRHLQKMKRYHLNEIVNIKSECECIREGKAAVLQQVPIKSNTVSNPTERSAIKILDDLDKKMDYHIMEIDRIDIKVCKVKDCLKGLVETRAIRVEAFEVLYYYFFEGMSNDEVAVAMNYSIESVYKIKASAIRKIAKLGEVEVMVG